MIRPFTCVCMVLAAGSGLYLYQQKHQAQLLDHEIATVMHTAEVARARTGVLRAEWTLENDPERLAALADRFLALKTVAPGQYIGVSDLDQRLPPVRTPDAAIAGTEPAGTDDDASGAAPSASSPEPPRPVVQAPDPSRPDKGADKSADKTPDKTKENPPARPASAKVVTAPPPSAPARVQEQARVQEHKPLTAAVAPILPSRTAIGDTHSAITPAMASVPRPLAPVAAYRPAYAAPVAAPAPVVTSVLGMARSPLPPPVPYQPSPVLNGGG